MEESSNPYVHPYIHKLLQMENGQLLEDNVPVLEGRNSTEYKFDGKDFPVDVITRSIKFYSYPLEQV